MHRPRSLWRFAVWMGLVLFLVSCAPGSAETNRGLETKPAEATDPSRDAANGSGATSAEPDATPERPADGTPHTPASDTAKRFTKAENTILGITLGVSTLEDVVAVLGQPEDQAEMKEGTADESITAQRFALFYDGFVVVCARDGKETDIAVECMIYQDVGLVGPRGIHIGMPIAQFDALFPHESGRKVDLPEGGTLEYLYERDEANTSTGWITRGAAPEDIEVPYLLLDALDGPFMDPPYSDTPQIALRVTCIDGVVADLLLGVR